MVAQSSANFPIFRGHARQGGRSFGAHAQKYEYNGFCVSVDKEKKKTTSSSVFLRHY